MFAKQLKQSDGKTIFMILFLLLSVVYGKLFCGKVCPFGWIQDWLHKIPVPLKIKTFKGDKQLRYLKYILLVLPLILPLFASDARNLEHSAESPLSVWTIAILLVLIFSSIIIYRPLCKYLCPWGALFSLFNLIAPYKYRIDTAKCTQCKKCSRICKMNIEPYKTPNHLECICCGKCKTACRKKAVYTGFKITCKQGLSGE
ncbi:4Fe-4S binding protein [termite gut metagenome]|uniref:4Fe-4S binding protein n=1 Tax=termite gut metagenome TaxID=433724 RepID=A0A5J4RBX1_9ZZZZ